MIPQAKQKHRLNLVTCRKAHNCRRHRHRCRRRRRRSTFASCHRYRPL